MPYEETITILENRKINEKYFKLRFSAKKISRNVQPGQFLNLQLRPSIDPFLRRPFSYYRVGTGQFEVLYEILGRGTQMLAQKKKGEQLRAIGPLGRPFTAKVKNKKRILIAGGVGVPPLVFLAEQEKVDYLLIGTKSKREVMPKSELRNVKAEILYSTNDGSHGKKGFVTALFEDLLKIVTPAKQFIQTCGPNVMMEAVIKIALKHGIEGEASVEKTMACGVGACLGCMVKTYEGWRTSCVEGPVFAFGKLDISHGL